MKKIAPGLTDSFDESTIQYAIDNKKILNADIEIGTICNWNCKYCYVSNKETTIEHERLIRIIDEVCRYGVRNILLTGGEPLLREDVFEIISHIRMHYGISASIFTNGLMIDKKTASKLFSLDVNVCLKFDSLDPTVQNSLCGADAYNSIHDAIKHLIDVGYDSDRLSIHSAITSHNVREIPAIWRWAKDQGIHFHCSRVVPHGNMRKNMDLVPDIEDLKRAFRTIHKREGVDVDIPFPGTTGCRKILMSCFIDTRGDVHPCSNIPDSGGNVLQRNLDDIIEKSEIFNLVRDIRKNLKGKCRNCEYSDICYGCRGIAHGLTGDIFAGDPLCWH